MKKSVQKYVRKIRKKVNPLYALAGVLILIVVIAAIASSGGGDDGDDNATSTTKSEHDKNRSSKPKVKGRRVKQAPKGSSGTIDTARREGSFVVAQARATVTRPSRISLRVSAAPKQRVTVDWQLSCFRDRRVRVGKGKYRVKAPDTRAISIPMSGAASCVATAGAQLTRYGRGRVKIAVVAG